MGVFGFGTYNVDYNHKDEAVRKAARRLEEQKAAFADSGDERIQFENDVEAKASRDQYSRYGEENMQRANDIRAASQADYTKRYGPPEKREQREPNWFGDIRKTINDELNDFFTV